MDSDLHISLSDFAYVKGHIAKIPYSFAKENLLLPLEEKEGVVTVASQDPYNFSALQEMRLILGKKVEIILATKEAMEKAIESCYHKMASFEEKEVEVKEREGYDLLEYEEKNPVVSCLNAIIREAIRERASDIHFEPQEGGIDLRYRIDGLLQKRPPLPPEYEKQILARVKVLAKLDIAEHRLPQDGRVKLMMGNREFDFRVSTLPVTYGERIVLRIHDRSQIVFGLQELGMQEPLISSFRKMLSRPEGIILVTGPTGSGKTTTLYSALLEVATSFLNIMTIEDPVEYKLPGIAQVNVNPKIHLNFAMGLRHILRQDPDVIMVGEIRDRETAEIAIQSALTGHLVFSTLHTNDAPSSLTRLVDMGIEPYLLSSSILGVLAQRLVRRLCPKCKTLSKAKEEEIAFGIQKKVYRGAGCEECFQTGYHGRIGIFEFMEMQENLSKQILKSADSKQLTELALQNGMVPLIQSGVNLILQGETSLHEILRVTKGK